MARVAVVLLVLRLLLIVLAAAFALATHQMERAVQQAEGCLAAITVLF
jgi:hypothetical protein